MAAGYYVSVIDGPRFGLLRGPFDAHDEALARVDETRKAAESLDPRAWFYAFGTCRVERETPLKPGKLNDVFT